MSRYKQLRLVLVALLLLVNTVAIGQAAAQPLIPEPKFSVLSTEQGLSQDTVKDLLLDRDQYLWVGTAGGLNRYDGYRVEHIKGQNGVLQDAVVSALFQDRDGLIWLSAELTGFFSYDPDSGVTRKVGDWRFINQPQWFQYASQISQDAQGFIWWVLNHQVIRMDPVTYEHEVVFQLPQDLIDSEHAIRAMWRYQDITLIGTSAGLFSLTSGANTPQPLDYLQGIPANGDNANVKMLEHFGGDTLWVGTVEGLYSVKIQQLVAHIQGQSALPDFTVQMAQRNIWRMQPVGEDRYFIGTDDGLYAMQVSSGKVQHLFQPEDSRYYITDNDIVDFVVDRSGNLWLATIYEGALYWSPQTMRFQNIVNRFGQAPVLSSGDIWSLYENEPDSLWIGSANGLNYFNLKSGVREAFLINPDTKAIFSESTISQIFSSPQKDLMLVTGEGLVRFNPAERKVLPLPSVEGPHADKLQGFIWGATQRPDDSLWFVRQEGIFVYDQHKQRVSKVEGLDQIDPNQIYNLISNVRGFPDSVFISSLGKLYEYNTVEASLRELHALPESAVHNSVAADSLVLDRNNTLWIAYPGYGLVGLNPETGEQHSLFDAKRGLPTPLIYGLQLDSEDNLWMSSHRGVLKFYQENRHFQRFGYEDGLVTLEFNQGAVRRLSDGRLAYGSIKGVSLFDPEQFRERETDNFSVRITDISLASRILNFSLNALPRRPVVMAHDDVGLTIQYSTLRYDHQKKTRYVYQLKGKQDIAYPSTLEPQVMFPKLEPGNYIFEVTAIDPASGMFSEPARVNITVRYAPWSSPVAYSVYFLVVFSIISLWWYRRLVQSHKLRVAHAEALKSKNRLSMAMSASNSNVWEWDNLRKIFYSPRYNEDLGYQEMVEEASFEQHVALIHEQDRKLFRSRWEAFLENHDPGFDVTYRMLTQSGKWQWYRDVGSAIREGDNNQKLLFAGTYTNITENLATREKVRLFGEAFRHTRDYVCIFNERHQAVAANQAFCDAFGIDESGDLDGQLVRYFGFEQEHKPRFWGKLLELKASDYWSGEEQFILSSGKACTVLINMTSVASVRARGEIDYYLVIMSDISEQKQAEEDLRQLANYDSLTGLPNRSLLLDRIKHGIDLANRDHSSLGLFFIDLDKFKQVNDSLGHEAGDQLLKVIAKRLTTLLRADDTVARLGGDEFVVMVEHVEDSERLSALAREIIDKLEEPISLSNQTVSVSSSIGIALYPGDASSPNELLKNSDVAMYHAKEQGRSNFQYFTEHMNKQAQARLALENRLKSAHQQKQFLNHYQPIVDIRQNRVEGFELLMRWPTDEGMIAPGLFIPVAEELGLIVDMTWDALVRAMPVLRQWLGVNPEIYLSVNLSARHFERQMSIELVMQLLQEHEVPVSALRFEITESALMRDYERALAYMDALKEHGFSIALDDFGTGYSSLKYLKEFPIEVLKIDRSFVADIGKDSSNEAIILTTLRMAESLNLYCIAEGIEQPEQLAFFRSHGCVHLQGYYFSRPVAGDETLTMLEQSWPDESSPQ